MTELHDFIEWFKTIDPDDFAMSDASRSMAVLEAVYERTTSKPALGLLGPLDYSTLVLGATDMEVDRFDELVTPTVRKSIVIEILNYYTHTGKIAWKRACKRFLSEETYKDVFPTE